MATTPWYTYIPLNLIRADTGQPWKNTATLPASDALMEQDIVSSNQPPAPQEPRFESYDPPIRYQHVWIFWDLSVSSRSSTPNSGLEFPGHRRLSSRTRSMLPDSPLVRTAPLERHPENCALHDRLRPWTKMPWALRIGIRPERGCCGEAAHCATSSQGKMKHELNR
jgi:hypothetical protein